jgi:GNAT superfamily N-acetyltransferase
MVVDMTPDHEPGAELVIETVDPSSPDARWCLAQYFAELAERFEGGFDPAESIVADHADLTPPHGAFLVARMGERPVGCGAVKRTSEQVGYLKRMWVDGSVRGRGLGRRLLAALEAATLELGCSVAQLETNRSLQEAIRLYRSAGYREVEPFNDEFYAHHWFEKKLVDG